MGTKSFRITVVLFAAIFLTFLGMRISLLEKTSRPKARPRAVLTLTAKMLSEAAADCSGGILSFDMDSLEQPKQTLPAEHKTIHLKSLKHPLIFTVLQAPQDRSPPHC
ncbi:MAG: hypothetical protein RW306_14900 [Geobacteraceae bacterium]|nr:hypothetical protein [Geobacteraceae bacterium]